MMASSGGDPRDPTMVHLLGLEDFSAQNIVDSDREKVCNENDHLINLPKDLQLALVSLLTRSDTMKLARCSRRLKKVFDSDRVWKDFCERDSLHNLPMTATTWKDKYKLCRGAPVIKNDYRLGREIDYELLQAHFLLKVDGVEHSLTLGNPKKEMFSEDEISDINSMVVFSGQDFTSIIGQERLRQGSFRLLLLHSGMVSVLSPEANVWDNFRTNGTGDIIYRFFTMIDLPLYFEIQLKRVQTVGDVEAEYRGLDYYTGIERIKFHRKTEEAEHLTMEALIANRLKWY